MKLNRNLQYLYKGLAVALLTYAILAGLLMVLPRVGTLGQTSRNLFYHVPMWFTMYLMMFISAGSSIAQLKKNSLKYDAWARETAAVGVLFGVLGLITGSIWSRVTWGALYPATDPNAWWSWDPKQTFALAAVLVYLAYFLLRGAIEDERKRARIAAVYNVFAGAALVPLTLIIPRAIGGLHPGSEDAGPLFDSKNMSDDYRIVFYPAILGFMLLACWMAELRVRFALLRARWLDRQANQEL